MKVNLRLLYLYLFSAIGLVVAIIGSVQLVNLGLKAFIFKEADRYYYPEPVAYIDKETGDATNAGQLRTDEEIQKEREKSVSQNRQREASNALAMIFVGLPVYLYHWRVLQRENKIAGAKN